MLTEGEYVEGLIERKAQPVGPETGAGTLPASTAALTSFGSGFVPLDPLVGVCKLTRKLTVLWSQATGSLQMCRDVPIVSGGLGLGSSLSEVLDLGSDALRSQIRLWLFDRRRLDGPFLFFNLGSSGPNDLKHACDLQYYTEQQEPNEGSQPNDEPVRRCLCLTNTAVLWLGRFDLLRRGVGCASGTLSLESRLGLCSNISRSLGSGRLAERGRRLDRHRIGGLTP